MSITLTGATIPVKVIVEQPTGTPVSNFGWVDTPVADVLGSTAGTTAARDAIKTKPQIAALTAASTAADIVAALKA